MAKMQELFDKYGGEPVPIQGGDPRLRLGILQEPPVCPCRVVAEELWQDMISAIEAGDSNGKRQA